MTKKQVKLSEGPKGIFTKSMDDINLQYTFDDAWLGITPQQIQYARLNHPFEQLRKEDEINIDRVFLEMSCDPDYFFMACKIFLNVELMPFQCVVMDVLWNHAFPLFIASRGAGKTFLLGVYCVLRMILVPETKVIMVGASFRQSKLIMEVIEKIWYNSPMLRDIAGQKSGFKVAVDRITFRFNDSTAIAIPIGNGDKIRGMRANVLLTDEFASINRQIFETVLSGFAAVSASPLENVKAAARRKAMKESGEWTQYQEREYVSSTIKNQTILSGTATFEFDDFFDYWQKYKSIVLSEGDPEKLRDIFKGNDTPENFSVKDYAVIRYPIEMVPEGFMDDGNISRSQATLHAGIYNSEYGAVFSADSDGFFRASLINACTTREDKHIDLPSGSVVFDTLVKGEIGKTYVLAVDPAAVDDNFSIVILEVYPDHRRVVYCWTTNKDRFRELTKLGLNKGQDNFYEFCCRKIRDLMKLFSVEVIALDSQGGGITISEILGSNKNLNVGEKPIFPIIDYDKPKDTDDMYGLHILELINFASPDWVSKANHGMRADFENKTLLFPRFDPIILAIAAEDDEAAKQAGKMHRIYDSLEDVVLEIEELKQELITIIMTRTGSGIKSRDHFDTPSIKLAHNKVGRLRKDRYSSLLMANMVARKMDAVNVQVEYEAFGGVAGHIPKTDGGNMYSGPEWFTNSASNFGAVIHKNR